MPLLIGVDLGSHAVKVTTYRSAGRRVELEDRFSSPVPQNGTPPTLAVRLAALEALLDEHPGWSTASAGLVMQGEEVSFRPLKMPFSDKNQIGQTLPFTIEGEVPYDLDDMVLGWRSTKDGEGSRVMSVLTRKDVLERNLAALSERGVDPRTVIADGELLGEYATGGSAAVIDVGHMHTTVTVVEDGEVRACRAINVGGYAFTKAIQGALDCEWHHAEALKHGQITDGDVTDHGGQRSGYASLAPAAKAAMDGAIGQLLAEIRSTLIRFEDETGIDISDVYLCGGSAKIPELSGYLGRDLGLPVHAVVDAEGDAVPPAFAASHAMARKVAGKSSGELVELRVGEHVFKGGVNTMRAVLTYGTAGAVFFAIAAVAIFTFQYISLVGELSDVNDRVAGVVLETFPEVPESQVSSGNKAVGIMSGFTADTLARSEMLPAPQKGNPPTIERLYQLNKALPPHEAAPVELTNLEFLPEMITFEGETDGFAQSAKVEETLKETAMFSRANKDSENRTSKGKVKFKFSIPLGEAEGEEESG